MNKTYVIFAAIFIISAFSYFVYTENSKSEKIISDLSRSYINSFFEKREHITGKQPKYIVDYNEWVKKSKKDREEVAHVCAMGEAMNYKSNFPVYIVSSQDGKRLAKVTSNGMEFFD